MRRRGLRLPMLTLRALLLVCGGLLAVCVCVGLALRASLTDFSSDPDALDELPYVMSARSTADVLTLRSAEEVEHAIEEARAQGFFVDAKDSAMDLGVATEDVADIAPLVLTGTFTGERKYVYQAFQCHIEVTSVISGEGVALADDLIVYDAYMIGEPRNFTGAGQFGDVREVQSLAAPGAFGLMPLREGQEYLFFLEPKVYPSEKDVGTYEQTYCLIQHPYARISLDVAEHPERVRVGASPSGSEWERIPFGEACLHDIAVTDEAAKELYLEGCARIIRETLGEA